MSAIVLKQRYSPVDFCPCYHDPIEPVLGVDRGFPNPVLTQTHAPGFLRVIWGSFTVGKQRLSLASAKSKIVLLLCQNFVDLPLDLSQQLADAIALLQIATTSNLSDRIVQLR
jgi:hypothetical protein